MGGCNQQHESGAPRFDHETARARDYGAKFCPHRNRIWQATDVGAMQQANDKYLNNATRNLSCKSDQTKNMDNTTNQPKQTKKETNKETHQRAKNLIILYVYVESQVRILEISEASSVSDTNKVET